jgi:small GTP-binding protein
MPPRKNSPAKDPRESAETESKSLDEQKASALNLFEKGERKGARKGKVTAAAADQGSLYGHLGSGDTMASLAGAKAANRAANRVAAAAATAAAEPEAAVVEEEPTKSVEVVGDKKIIHFKPPIIIKELAAMMELRPVELMKDLMEMEIFATLTQAIEPEIAAKVCEKHGFVFEKERREKGGGVHKVEEVIEVPEVQDIKEVEEDKLRLRPPVVTFMGHVDHGKTSLLDAFRGSRVVSGEAGGITQHIGAYEVVRDGKSVTFIDTPGHAAFSEMRARGANVTDIVVLVVAADDGLMPTTLEAIDHCKAAGVTIIVALNKCDLPRADLHRAKGQLQDVGLTPEEYGGSTLCVEVSAKTGMGLDTLFEMIHLQAEVLELKANFEGPARGIVIEARTEAGKGPTATVLVQSGTLDVGDSFICGVVWGKVKAILDDKQKRIPSAGPSTPVEIVGYSAVPSVGDELVELENERKAKKAQRRAPRGPAPGQARPHPALRPRDPLQQHRAGQKSLPPPHHQGRCPGLPPGHREIAQRDRVRQDLRRDPAPERGSHHRGRRHPRQRLRCHPHRLQHQGRGQGPAHREARRRAGEALLHHLRTHRPGQRGHARPPRARDPRESRRTRQGPRDLQALLRQSRRLFRHRWTPRPPRPRPRPPRRRAHLRRRLLHPAPFQGRREGSQSRPRVRRQARSFQRLPARRHHRVLRAREARAIALIPRGPRPRF